MKNKSTLFSAVAALALATPLIATSASAQSGSPREQQQSQQQGYGDRDSDRDGNRGDARNDRRNDETRGARDRRENWRDDQNSARWDDTRHNGYYENNRWTYGRPSDGQYNRPGFSLGYRPWAVGQNLGYYSGRFQTVDYRSAQLRRPARGAHWVRDDRGDYLLVNRSGRILQVMISGQQPRDRRQSWREDRADARWDDTRYNGYYRNNTWSYGPPSGDMRGVVYGYQPWQRGQRLGYYDGRYQEVDYRSNRSLRPPPRGYHWVRNDGGDYLLAAIAGGLIAQVILNSTR
ncbi:MAG: RcnB family protein [Hyphomonadaceae bacterium JAD_PAG50586_4]|nr:MAG: RcnB family protein [Hyphomonadaceae bacterium JAD_PAG50586_4]